MLCLMLMSFIFGLYLGVKNAENLTPKLPGLPAWLKPKPKFRIVKVKGKFIPQKLCYGNRYESIADNGDTWTSPGTGFKYCAKDTIEEAREILATSGYGAEVVE